MQQSAQVTSTVLVVHKDRSVRDIAQEILTEHGYRVVALESGLAMIRAIREQPPDLVLLDTGGRLRNVVPNLELLHALGCTETPVVLLSTDSKPDMDDCIAVSDAVQDLRLHGIITMPFEDIDILAHYAGLFCTKIQAHAIPSWAEGSYQVQGSTQPQSSKSNAPRSARPHRLRPRSGAHHLVAYRATSAARWYLAIALVILVGLSGIGALTTPNGMAVFEKILPALMFATGYFFNRQ